MKTYLLCLIIILLVSCSKSSDTNNSTGNDQDGWTFGTKTYNTYFTSRFSLYYGNVRQARILEAYDTLPSGSQVDVFQIWFAEYPVGSGSYSIVELPDLSVTSLTPNQCAVRLYGYGASSFAYSTKNGITETGKIANVTVTGTKIKVLIPAINLKNESSSSILPQSQIFTGTLIER